MLQHASVIVANSSFTRTALESHVKATNRLSPSCEVVPLGISPLFLEPSVIRPVETETPYFLVVGTIEARKNLVFLLQVWHRWTTSVGAPQARLVIVGRRGWQKENIVDLLERSPGLVPTVIEVTALSDAGIVALMRGAAALLAPSFVEGFGLPIAEALAVGVPVIASDIGAFREVAGGFAEYIDPLDGRKWMQALDDYSRPELERRRQRLELLRGYRPVSWSDHLRKVDDIVAGVVGESGRHANKASARDAI